MTRRILFTLASIFSFAAGAYCFSVLLFSCAGHPPYSQIGLSILPVSAFFVGLFSFSGITCWNLRQKDELANSDGKRPFSRLAILSLLLSSMGMVVPFLGVGGIVAGHISRRKCRSISGMSGSGVALFGLILGYASVLYFTYVFIIVPLAAGTAS